MEAYLTLCYSIKYEEVRLLQNVFWKVCIIMQDRASQKLRYFCESFQQLHIIDKAAADLVLQETYLANTLVNSQSLLHTFYEIDLLLEY